MKFATVATAFALAVSSASANTEPTCMGNDGFNCKVPGIVFEDHGSGTDNLVSAKNWNDYWRQAFSTTACVPGDLCQWRGTVEKLVGKANLMVGIQQLDGCNALKVATEKEIGDNGGYWWQLSGNFYKNGVKSRDSDQIVSGVGSSITFTLDQRSDPATLVITPFDPNPQPHANAMELTWTVPVGVYNFGVSIFDDKAAYSIHCDIAQGPNECTGVGAFRCGPATSCGCGSGICHVDEDNNPICTAGGPCAICSSNAECGPGHICVTGDLAGCCPESACILVVPMCEARRLEDVLLLRGSKSDQSDHGDVRHLSGTSQTDFLGHTRN